MKATTKKYKRPFVIQMQIAPDAWMENTVRCYKTLDGAVKAVQHCAPDFVHILNRNTGTTYDCTGVLLELGDK